MWLFGKSKLPGGVCVIEGLTISADEVRKEYLTNIDHLCLENGELRGQPVLDDPPSHALCLFRRGIYFRTVLPLRISLLTLEVSLVSEPLRKACRTTNAAWEQAFVEKLEQGGYAPDRAGELGALVQVMIDGAIISSMGRKDTLPLRRAAAAIPTLLKGDI